MAYTQEQIDKIIQHIDKVWPKSTRTCPICTTLDPKWILADHPFSMINGDVANICNGPITIGQLSFVVFICTVCGHAILFNGSSIDATF